MFASIKAILAVIIVVATGIYFFDKYKESHPEQFDGSLDSLVSHNPAPGLTISGDSTVTSSENENTLVAPDPELFTLRLEDPDEQPYGMFVGAYQHDAMVFRINLPDNELLESSDSILQFKLPEKKGTNLTEENFTIAAHKGECSMGDDMLVWSKTTIGDIEFDKAASGDAGAGQRYSYYFYNWKRKDYCVTFTLELKSFNAGMTDPPTTEYDEKGEVKMMEDLLRTIKNN